MTGLQWRITLTFIGLVLAWLAWRAVTAVILGLLAAGIFLLVVGVIVAVVVSVLRSRPQ